MFIRSLARSCTEWMAYALFLIGVTCIAAGVFTRFFGVGGLDLVVDRMRLELRCERGTFLLTDCIENADLMDGWANQNFEPKIISDWHFPMPGFEFRRFVYRGGDDSWYLRQSMMAVGCVMLIASWIAWRSYVRQNPALESNA